MLERRHDWRCMGLRMEYCMLEHGHGRRARWTKGVMGFMDMMRWNTNEGTATQACRRDMKYELFNTEVWLGSAGKLPAYL